MSSNTDPTDPIVAEAPRPTDTDILGLAREAHREAEEAHAAVENAHDSEERSFVLEVFMRRAAVILGAEPASTLAPVTLRHGGGIVARATIGGKYDVSETEFAGIVRIEKRKGWGYMVRGEYRAVRDALESPAEREAA